MQNKAVN